MRQPDLPIFEIEQPLLETLTTQKRWVLTAPTPLGEIDPNAADAARRGLLRAGARIF
jgi:hypothetical protein